MKRYGMAWMAAIFAIGSSVLISGRSALSDPGTDLLPDLKTLNPKDLQIENVTIGGQLQKRLRFDNEVVNAPAPSSAGIGPLELFPVADDCDGDLDFTNDRSAVQRVYQEANGDGYFTRGVDTTFTTRHAGCMVLHPAHDHWHFDGFSRYELRLLPGTNGTVVGVSEKVTFCIADVWRRHPELPGSPSQKYYQGCGKVSIQGLSIGWSDEYPSYVEGQHVVITGLPDGDYCLVSTADPLGLLLESDETNNQSAIRLTLSGNSVNWSPYRSCESAAIPPEASLNVSLTMQNSPQPGSNAQVNAMVTHSDGLPVANASVAVGLDTADGDTLPNYSATKTTNGQGRAMFRFKTKSWDALPWTISASVTATGYATTTKTCTWDGSTLTCP